MKKTLFLFLTLVSLVHRTNGADEPARLGGFPLVSLTSTNITLMGLRADGLTMKDHDHADDFFMKAFTIDDKQVYENTVFTISLDKEVSFHGRHDKMIYTPFLLANQQKGFRIIYLFDNRRAGYDASSISYITLSDNLENVDESDVEMILENGEWMKIEDAESLEVKKLKWKAMWVIYEPNSYVEFINNTTIIPANFGSSYYGPLFVELIQNGLVVPDAKMLALLKSAGFLPSGEEPDEKTPLVAPGDAAQTNENAMPPSLPSSCRFARRAGYWWLVLPAVAGAWFVFRLKKET